MGPCPWITGALVVTGLLAGCKSPGSGKDGTRPFRSAGEVREAVAAGPARVQALSAQLTEIQQEFVRFARTQGPQWKQRGYLNAEENDRMETGYFQFTAAQDGLLAFAQGLGGRQPADLFPDNALRTTAHLLAVDAQFLLIFHRAELVGAFSADPIAAAKLNEAFFRSEIPRGSYDRIRLGVTSKESAQRLESAWALFQRDCQGAEIQKLVREDPAVARLVAAVPDDYLRAKAARDRLAGNSLASALAHSEAAAAVRRAETGWGDLKYRIRSGLFKDVSRIRNPRDKVIVFSAAQHAQVKRLLEPGDIILTYTAGYMSDVFIPGRFKHGITYVGSPAQRMAAGLNAARLPELAAPERAVMAEVMERAILPDGKEADVIEAVAEGVIFNNLGHLMETHINRLLVLRPLLNGRERADFLTGVFSFHGDPYDFLFDFGDASRQVCTEVIYRGLNGKAGIRFPLTRRGGHPTLSADDVVDYHFKAGGRHFEVVLYAEEDFSRAGHRALVFTGAGAERKLKQLMAVESASASALRESFSSGR